MKKSAKSAFTLIELLVVIAIIAILAAIAIPVFSSAMERAHATDDANKLRQLGIGMNQYLSDNDDTFFATDSNPPWAAVLQAKYVPDWHAFQSPFDKRIPPAAGANANPTMPLSYGINANVYAPSATAPANPNNTYNGSVSQWVAPSELIIAADAPDQNAALKFSGVSTTNLQLSTPALGAKYGVASNRNMINALYGDWHIAPVLWRDFSDTASNPTGLRRWNPLGKQPGT